MLSSPAAENAIGSEQVEHENERNATVNATTTVNKEEVIDSSGGNSRRREERGERRRKRYETTLARHAANEKLIERNRQHPETIEDFASRWDEVYSTKLPYKDRHLLRCEIPDIVSPIVKKDPKLHVPRLNEQEQHEESQSQSQYLLEIGCGTGSTVFPLLRANPLLFAIVFDISKEAIMKLKQCQEYQSSRLFAFQADASNIQSYLPCVLKYSNRQLVHFITIVWTLSAMSKSQRLNTVMGLSKCIQSNGLIYVRDFAIHDMRHMKMSVNNHKNNVNKIEERLFLRGDGTYAYFFEKDELKQLFEDTNQFVCESCEYEERCVKNRKEEITMNRRWVVAKFRKV